MLRTRSNPSTSTSNTTPPSQNLTPAGSGSGVIEPDTPLGHYDHRTHAHATPEHENGQTFSKSRMNTEGLAARRGEKGMFLNGLSRLQSLGGGKGKGKAQYRLGMSLYGFIYGQWFKDQGRAD
jgi:hypothetical protein